MFGFFKKTYSIKKDAKPEDTLKRLRAIFNNLGITLVESEFFNYNKDKSAPCSLRLTIANTTKGQNGKGKTKLTALCSAYSELVERMSCLTFVSLSNDEFCYSPDEVFYDFEKISVKQKDYIKKTFFSVENNTDISEDYLKNIFEDKLGDSSFFNYTSKGFFCVPFYDVLNDEIIYLPSYFITWKNHASGMCAGNTREEALVQGLSEIFERYAQREILSNEYSLPTIPKQYYEKYSDIKMIIEYIERNGYHVVVKDASIGMDLPVVLTIFVDKKNNQVSYCFGAHPDFPIALERTLTEFLQGFPINIEKEKKFSILLSFLESKDKKVYSELALTTGKITFYDINHPLISSFLKDETDFVLNKEFISAPLCFDNNILLKKLIILSKTLSSNLFVRDMSFLGFPAFIIEVPCISEIERRSVQSIEALYSFKKLKKFLYGEIQNISADQIISAIDYPYLLYYDIHNYLLYGIPNHFLLAIAYLEKGEKDKTVELLDIVLQHKNVFTKHLPMVAELQAVLKCNKTISEIDDESIRKTVEEYLAYPLKTLLDFAKELRKEYKLDDKKQIESIEVERIKKILISKYIENTPNQENLREFFKKILSQD